MKLMTISNCNYQLITLGLPVVEELEEGQRSQLGPRGLVLHLVGLEWLASLRVLLVLLLGLFEFLEEEVLDPVLGGDVLRDLLGGACNHKNA